MFYLMTLTFYALFTKIVLYDEILLFLKPCEIKSNYQFLTSLIYNVEI